MADQYAGASNYSIQPGKGEYDRPPMKQESHPEHNMPASEYNGDTKSVKTPTNPPVKANPGFSDE